MLSFQRDEEVQIRWTGEEERWKEVKRDKAIDRERRNEIRLLTELTNLVMRSIRLLPIWAGTGSVSDKAAIDDGCTSEASCFCFLFHQNGHQRYGLSRALYLFLPLACPRFRLDATSLPCGSRPPRTNLHKSNPNWRGVTSGQIEKMEC